MRSLLLTLALLLTLTLLLLTRLLTRLLLLTLWHCCCCCHRHCCCLPAHHRPRRCMLPRIALAHTVYEYCQMCEDTAEVTITDMNVSLVHFVLAMAILRCNGPDAQARQAPAATPPATPCHPVLL